MQTFSKTGTFDQAAVDGVRLRPVKPWLNNPFSDHEVGAAVRKLANGKSAGDVNAQRSTSKSWRKMWTPKYICAIL